MTQIGNHDDAYLSTPLEAKLAWFQNAPGLSAVEPARQFMAGAAALYTDSDAQVRATMRGLGADWTGDAASNAGATLQRAADWSKGAGAGNSAGGETVEGYGQSFESLRGQVHWDDPWAWGWNDTASAAASVATLDPGIFLGNLTTDYFTTAQQNRTNDAAAVAALRAHEQQTRAAVESFPALAPAAIDPSSADTGVTPGRPHPGGGLAAVPAAPAGAATAASGGGVAGALAGGVVAGMGAAVGGLAAANSRAGGGMDNGGGGGAITTPVGVVTDAPGHSSAATGPVGSPGAAIAGVSGAPAGPGGVGTGALGAGGVGAGGFGAGGFGAGGGETLGPTDGVAGGSGSRVGIPGQPIPGLRAGDPSGRLAGSLPPGGGTSDGAGGLRDLVPHGTSEPGAVSRGPTSGGEFAARLPSGSPGSASPIEARGGAAGAGMPLIGGMGGGAGARSTEHRQAYWIRSSEPFDVPLPPHGDGLLQGSDE